MKRLLIFLSVFLVAATSVKAQEEFKFSVANVSDTYQQLLAEAREQEKMLIVALVDDQDTAWKRMNDEGVFQDSAVVTALQNYQGIMVPVSSQMGIAWVDLFPVAELPALYFLNDGEILLEILVGFQNADSVAGSAKESYSNRNLYEGLSNKYGEQKLTIKEWSQLLEIHSRNFPYHQTQNLAMEFLNGLTSEQLLQKEVLPILIQYGTDLESKYPEFIINNRKKISATNGFNFSEYFSRLYSFNLDRAVINGDSILLDKLVDIVLPLNPDTAVSTPDLILETKKLYVEETAQFSVWVDAVLEYFATETNDSLKAEALFEQAYHLAENYETATARKGARELANEANKVNTSYRYLMLEGYMAYLLSDFSEAEKLVQQAKNLTTNPIEQRNADGLMEMIQKRK